MPTSAASRDFRGAGRERPPHQARGLEGWREAGASPAARPGGPRACTPSLPSFASEEWGHAPSAPGHQQGLVTGLSEAPAPGRGNAPPYTPGGPRSRTHLAPSLRSPESPPRTSAPNTPPPCHRNVHRRLPRLQRCII